MVIGIIIVGVLINWIIGCILLTLLDNQWNWTDPYSYYTQIIFGGFFWPLAVFILFLQYIIDKIEY